MGEEGRLSSEREARRFAGMAFVACMFIGAGMGLMFDRPDVGGAIGMGVGFLLMGFIRVRGVKVSEALVLPRTLPNIIFLLIGALLTIWGVALILCPEIIWPYLSGVSAIALGALMIALGASGLRGRRTAPEGKG